MNWREYIKQAIKVGLESPIPYKVISYKMVLELEKLNLLLKTNNTKGGLIWVLEQFIHLLMILKNAPCFKHWDNYPSGAMEF